MEMDRNSVQNKRGSLDQHRISLIQGREEKDALSGISAAIEVEESRPADSGSQWSESLEKIFNDTRKKILEDLPRAGAASTDYDAEYDKSEHIEQMPHLRALTGMLIYLERQSMQSPQEEILTRFETALRTSGIRSILEVGAGARGPLLWLARTGIAQKLDIDMYAVECPGSRWAEPEPWEDLGVKYIFGDGKEAESLIGGKIDLVLAAGVLSIGGQEDYMDYCRFHWQDRLEYFQFCHEYSLQLARSLVSALSDNPSAAVIATSWKGSLALRREELEQFAAVHIWQPSPSASESDREIIPNVPEPEDLDNLSTEQLLAWRQRRQEISPIIEFARSLLGGIKLAVFGRQSNILFKKH